jgi:alcohol dehydrogenase (cytochrome c)
VALDAATGRKRWDVVVADYQQGYSLTLAPLAIGNKILVGPAGGELGIRGFIAAYDAQTGKEVWRFHTIPGPGEPGHETWTGDAWQHGGASVWLTGSYDPQLNLTYWGIGNPGPDWNPELRHGDNLYSDSVIALDPDTGKLKWHFQFTPHDSHDWDSTHVPVLFEADVRGTRRKLVAVANRNAFYYVLDRTTGEFVTGLPYARQTWAKGLDDRGRPIVIPNTEPSPQGTLVWPNLNGATVWFSPAFSPLTQLVYVAVREIASVYFKREADYKPGTFFAGGGEASAPGEKASGAIRALEAATGRKRWEFPMHSAPWSGVLATAGGLVFSGSDEGNFFALDAKTGKPLWEFQTGGRIAANPISYAVDGKQYIAIASNRVLYVFGL